MSEHTLAILVKALGTGEASKKLKGIDAVVAGIGKTARKGIGTAASNLLNLGAVAAGVAVGGLAAAVHAAGDFEAQLRTINTVAGLSPDALAKVGDGIRKIARDTGTPLEDLTQGYYDLVSAGVAAADAQGVLVAANTLAIGGLGTTAETIDLLTTAINSYGGDASRATEFADKFAESIAAGKVTASELAASFATVGPIAANSGIEIDELAAGYARMTAQGVPAAEVATEMRSALVGLLSPNAQLNALQDKTKTNFAALAKDKGLVVALEELRKQAAKAGIPMIDLLGRVEGFNFAVGVTGDNLPAYNAELAKVGASSGLAAKQMSERQQGLNFQLGRLKSLAIDAAITIGNKLLPKLTPLAERAVKFLDTHQADISAFGDKIAAGFDKAVQFAEKIPWGAIGSGLQTAATWAGTLMGAFTALPPDVQATIFALAGLNKLSGGAIGSIVGQLGSGLIKGVLGMTAGIVNINAATVNGAGGAAGAAAKAGGMSLLGALGVAGIIDVVAAEVVGPIVRDWALKNNLAGSGDTAGKTQAQIAYEAMHPAHAVETGGLSPDDRQVLSDQKKATEALGVYEQQAIRDAATQSNREIGALERVRSGIAALTLKPPTVTVVGSTTVYVSADSMTSAQTTTSTWTGSTKYATAV